MTVWWGVGVSWSGVQGSKIYVLSSEPRSGKKKAHKHKLLVRLLLGHPGNVPGTNRVCPRDKVGLSQGQTQVFSFLYTVEAQFVPGTNPVCPRDIPGTTGGRKSLCVKSLCAFFVPYKEQIFCPGTRPGRPLTGVSGQSFMCQSFMRLFCSLLIDQKKGINIKNFARNPPSQTPSKDP